MHALAAALDHSAGTSVLADAPQALTCPQWTKLMQCARAARGLSFSEQAFRKSCASAARMEAARGATALRQVFDFAALKPEWQRELETLRARHDAATFADLYAMMICETRIKPVDPTGLDRKLTQYKAGPQLRARWKREAFNVYFLARDAGRTKTDAVDLLRIEWTRILTLNGYAGKRTIAPRKVYDWIAQVEKCGGVEAPLEAYLDNKSCPHPGARQDLPADFVTDFIARMLDSSKGVPGVPQVFADYEAAWQRGEIIPGLGCRCQSGSDSPDELFPLTVEQLDRYAPSRAAREVAGRGKFLARTTGHLAAPPLSWADVEPMRVVFFDDKVLDVLVMTDDERGAYRPHIYLAYCGGTGRVLSFIARPEGKMTKLDVEGLQCAVLRDYGFGGPEVGWPTRWVKERGTVSISDKRKALLESLFPGRLEICRTSMVGGKVAKGDWTQKGAGNFFGKGRLEAFMGALDHLAKSLPGATGRDYSVQPASLGDTTLTIEKIVNSARRSGFQPLSSKAKHSGSGSQIEESLLTGLMAQALHLMETGELEDAYTACKEQGLRPPMLHSTEFESLLGELFRQHNTRRGHSMNGFADIRVPHPHGGTRMTTESPADKAMRMHEAMRLQGRQLMRPDDRDLVALMHKLKRVTVTPAGVVTEGLTYWHPQSQAQRDAAAIAGAKTVRLALYNPVQPDALYLLANPPGHVPAAATETPKDFIPQLSEVLPLYQAPSIVDAEGMAKRNADVQAFNNKVMREVAIGSAPIIAARTQQREQLSDRLAPLRATIMSAASPVAPTPMSATPFGHQMTEAEAVLSAAASRVEARREAQAAAEPAEATGFEQEIL